MDNARSSQRDEEDELHHSKNYDAYVIKKLATSSNTTMMPGIKVWGIVFSLLFSTLLLVLLLNPSALRSQDVSLGTSPSPPRVSQFKPLPHYDLTAVRPLDALSRVPRIRAPGEQRTISMDPSPNCLKHPSNGVDDDCWNALRRDQYLRVLDELYESPDSVLARFKPDDNWQIFDLITPTYRCDANSLRRVGVPGDGGKWVCGPIRVLGPKCVIFSLGSNNQFDFEEAIDAHTGGECEIHTFDCTGVWSNPHTKFHPWCFGGEDKTDENGRIFKRLSTAAREIGVTSISLLKMDIELAEFDVFEGLKFEDEGFLPDQILFELHTFGYPATSKHKDDWPRTVMDLVRDIDAMGYSFAFEERNLGWIKCCEYVIVRDRPSTINPKNNTWHD
ncbi:uncharacterized protein LOC112349514 isoform X1 [Selaginella moellendorffii]|uniref:uncharacterized protein LOC112349514 isoform X1 n=1 Tax=Selaginella moellendorffii TaxID=88036 RepID=UPI000D1D112C|nr:uncharacterized protein LOC112349514 isoform X1 [Selaginella moellendorffii]|eukprot:XP_024539853.1 uncharacterized protein LOC112349514 isoform X1 [Selaginella moellendorffii]